MKINAEFDNINSIEEIVKKFNEKQKGVIVNRLNRIGEKCVNVARNLPSPTAEAAGKKHQPNYIDWTGNLRHSISYLVGLDGEIKNSDIRNDKIKESPSKNLSEETANKVLSDSGKGIILIMVAGMDYAPYVSKKGYDVLDSAVLEMKSEFQKLVALINKV